MLTIRVETCSVLYKIIPFLKYKIFALTKIVFIIWFMRHNNMSSLEIKKRFFKLRFKHHGEYGELLIMPANDRWDLILRLKS